jgi:hypothetical protein
MAQTTKNSIAKEINSYLRDMGRSTLTKTQIHNTKLDDLTSMLNITKRQYEKALNAGMIGGGSGGGGSGGSGSGGSGAGGSGSAAGLIAQDNQIKLMKEKSILEQQTVQDTYLLDLQNKQNAVDKLRSDLFAKSIATEYVIKDGVFVQKPNYVKLLSEARVTTSIGAGVRGSSRNNKSGEWSNDQLKRHMIKLRV